MIKLKNVSSVLVALSLLNGCGMVNAPVVGSGKVSYGDSNAVETVNTDFGCGIIRRLNKLESLIKCFSSFRMQRRPNVFNQWNKLKNDDFSAAFRFLNAHAKDLLKLKSVTEFLEETSHPEQRPLSGPGPGSGRDSAG